MMETNERNSVVTHPGPGFGMNPYSNSKPPRRRPPTDHEVREEIIKLLRASALPSTEMLGRLRRTMVVKESQFTAVREDLHEEGIIENKGNEHRHLWALTDGSTPVPAEETATILAPATLHRGTQAASGALPVDHERSALELIGKQALELGRLRQLLARFSESLPAAET
jgi:hypothetical protein